MDIARRETTEASCTSRMVNDREKKWVLHDITLYVPYGSCRYGESSDEDLVQIRLAFFSEQILGTIMAALESTGVIREGGRIGGKRLVSAVLEILNSLSIPASAACSPQAEVVTAYPPPPRENFGVIVRACLEKDYPGVFDSEFIGNALDPCCLLSALEWHRDLRVRIGASFPTRFTAKKAIAAVVQHTVYQEERLFINTKGEYLSYARKMLSADLAEIFGQLLYDGPTNTRDIDKIFVHLTGRQRDMRAGAILFRVRQEGHVIRDGERFWCSTTWGQEWKPIRDDRLHYLLLPDVVEVGTFRSAKEAMEFVRLCESRNENHCLPPSIENPPMEHPHMPNRRSKGQPVPVCSDNNGLLSTPLGMNNTLE